FQEELAVVTEAEADRVVVQNGLDFEVDGRRHSQGQGGKAEVKAEGLTGDRLGVIDVHLDRNVAVRPVERRRVNGHVAGRADQLSNASRGGRTCLDPVCPSLRIVRDWKSVWARWRVFTFDLLGGSFDGRSRRRVSPGGVATPSAWGRCDRSCVDCSGSGTGF